MRPRRLPQPQKNPLRKRIGPIVQHHPEQKHRSVCNGLGIEEIVHLEAHRSGREELGGLCMPGLLAHGNDHRAILHDKPEARFVCIRAREDHAR